ncbi:MAG: excinuclease ABC subunit UvrA [Patescibacteria group bacterium]
MIENEKSKNTSKEERKEAIEVVKARTHNLRDLSVSIPRNVMTVFTGLSGSGKSSLAFDTIFAEGQRRYIESLSAYARQFLKQMQKPDVDEIRGLSPAISIDQKSRSNNPRSTVATVTEIYDYFRILFARIGRPHCLECGREIQKLSNEEIKETVLKKVNNYLSSGASSDISSVNVYAPVVRGRKGEYYQMLYDLLKKGYEEVRVNGENKSLREKMIISRNKRHDIDVLVDEIEIAEFSADKGATEERFGEDLEVALNEAEGLVRVILSDKEGGKKEEFLLSSEYSCPYDGYSYPEIEPRLFSFNSPYGACPRCKGTGSKYFFSKTKCPECNGARLRPEALNVFVGDKNIAEVTGFSIKNCMEFFTNLKLSEREKEISRVVIKEIMSRLEFMNNVGIEYLTLDRNAGTISGGEAQRIRLASQLGAGLVGALYVLDEPTIGLHPRDNDRLVRTLHRLRDLGNTIIVVEHDEETIFSSDYLVDIGPGPGIHGGEVVVDGYLDELLSKDFTHNSLTLEYLREEKQIPLPDFRRNNPAGKIVIRGGNVFNIKNMNVELPLGRFCVVTGVSGSGKSSFVYEILHRNLKARLNKRYRSPEIYNCDKFSGTEYLSREISIDQSAIGRTPRSNPATYTGAFTFIRELFAETAEARIRGWKPGRFSFNVKGGRCETCKGKGVIEVEMHFLPTVYVPCDVCRGKRFTKETLEVKYKDKSIYEVLEMTVEEALGFFEDIPAIYDRLKTLDDVGLGYLKLGQSATTLSGGEAQRVKISSELFRQHIQKTIYILDEPTIGLHYEDVAQLIKVLQRLVDKGNTVVIIEHNLDLIKSADYVIDIGPDGGDRGGKIVAKGTPEQVAQNKDSYTGRYLKPKLKIKKKKDK